VQPETASGDGRDPVGLDVPQAAKCASIAAPEDGRAPSLQRNLSGKEPEHFCTFGFPSAQSTNYISSAALRECSK
jgi:hypothetical protein